MKKIDLGQTITILANTGVIASLIFLGMQVRLEAAASRAATFQQLKSSWVQANLAEATSVDLAKAFVSAETQGWDNTGPVERRLLSGYIRTLFHNWSNAYYHYEDGTLDENQWQASVREMRSGMSNPLLRQVWSEWGFVFDDRFGDLMKDVLAESEAETK
jgi:hypothetical protein